MSVKIMAAVFESSTLGPTLRLILLSLADHADDEGRCYPSIARLAQRTGLSERAVQCNLRELKRQGYIDVQINAGKHGSNLYIVCATPTGNATPAAYAPPAPDAPRTRCTPQEVRTTPAAYAPKPSKNHQDDDEAAPLKSSIEEMAPRPEAPPDDFDEAKWKASIASAMGISERDARKLCDRIGMAEIRSWIALPHVTAEAICSRISLVMTRRDGKAPNSLAYFTSEIRDLSDELAQPANEPVPRSGRRAPARTSAAASAASKPVDDDALARSWVDAVKAGKTYAASAIRKHVASRMLALGLVTEDELRRCGVAF